MDSEFDAYAGLQREGAAEQGLQAQLEEVQAEEATLPGEIKAVQTVLEGELEALKALEASTSPAGPPLTNPFMTNCFATISNNLCSKVATDKF